MAWRVSSLYGSASEYSLNSFLNESADLYVTLSSVKNSVWQGGMLEYSEMQEAAPYWL